MNLLYDVSNTVLNNYYFGCATNQRLRYEATSGGIGIAIIKYLLNTPQFETALTFAYDRHSFAYVPLFVYSVDDINNCGSIYQDINVFQFVKKNLSKIKGGVVISCPPCQVKPIKRLLLQAQIKSFIISFSCSGQTIVEGTWKYFELVGIDKCNVKNLRYRGNGWPSGIQIDFGRGNHFYRDNWTSPWTIIQSSRLYTPDRCMYCVMSGSLEADISLADPWLENFIGNDVVGHTLIRVNTIQCKETLDFMLSDNNILLSRATEKDFLIAQEPNVNKKIRVSQYKKAYSVIIKLKRNMIYRKLATFNVYTLIVHNYIQRFIYYILKSDINDESIS